VRRSLATRECVTTSVERRDHEVVGDQASELRDILNEWDFIGVFDPESNTDEYDCMIRPLLRTLAAGADTKDIARFLDVEITGHFGMSPGLVETAPTAERLAEWWQGNRP
jgi:hypothetical protein